MPTIEIVRGLQFEIRAWVDSAGKCPTVNFLTELKANGDSDAQRLSHLMERTAATGIVRNERHVRSLEDGIFEFKAPNSARVLFFYDKNRLIICSHGFTGKSGIARKNIKAQMETAMRIKKEYFDTKGE
jgi:hypothetical protein